jgi:hypothetical protein
MVRVETLIVRQGSVPDPGQAVIPLLPDLGACLATCRDARGGRGELAVRLTVGENGAATSIDVLVRKNLDACALACMEPVLSRARFTPPVRMPAAVEVFLSF